MKNRILLSVMLISINIVAFGMLNSSAAVIDSGACGDNLTYVLNDIGTLTISGSGDMWNWKVGNNAPWSSFSDDVEKVIINHGITSIGNQAFWNWYKNLTSVTLPDSITSIGDYAFDDCSGLTSIAIPDGVKTIGRSAFSYCSSLSQISMPNTITSIGLYAFSHCESLATVYYSGSKNDWNTIDIASDNAYLTNAIIYYNNIIDSGTCGDNVTWTLDKDYVLTISGTGNMKTSPMSTPWYSYIHDITSVILNNGVTSIGNSAFAVIDIPSIKIPDSITHIGASAFEKNNCITDIELPSDVTYIGELAFYWCDKLKNINIPDKVKYIGDSAFAYCTNLESITIPNSISKIEMRTFMDCSNMKSIIIPDNVTSIGKYAFDGCNNLSTVYYEGSEEDWNRIVIGAYNDNLVYANIVYNYSPIQISKNDTTYTVNLTNTENGKTVVFALYNGSRLSEMQQKKYCGNELTFTPTNSYSSIKVMIWDNLNTLTPICKAKTILK